MHKIFSPNYLYILKKNNVNDTFDYQKKIANLRQKPLFFVFFSKNNPLLRVFQSLFFNIVDMSVICVRNNYKFVIVEF